MAIGYAIAAGPISANANNSFQFGMGTNSLASSLKVGVGIRLSGLNTALAAPVDGDIWLEGTVVKVRSNGVTVSL
jgi:hypothetical protein